MSLRELKDRFLAIPWVYDKIRPLVAGGIDLRSLADFCGLSESDRVFDLGCGTAQLLEFLTCERYLGVDLDASAIERALRFESANAHFISGDGWDEEYCRLRPTVVLMIGVVHHVSDAIFQSMLARLRQAGTPLPRLVTIDVTFLPGQPLNNIMSRLDRGRHVRNPDQYEKLFLSGGLQICRKKIIATRMRYVRYIGYHLALE